MDQDPNEQSRHYTKIAQAIAYLTKHRSQQPTLSSVASHIGVSEFHFQKLFSLWVGVSPKQFLQFLTVEYAKQQLQTTTVYQAALNSGLSGGGRLHDLMITCEGITPGEYKKQGNALHIDYGVHLTPFGVCILAKTHRGICHLSFLDDMPSASAIKSQLASLWPLASISRNDGETQAEVNSIFKQHSPEKKSLHLLLKGTSYQLNVWKALLSVPEGNLISYQQLANKINKPTATRSVASAVARNNIALLIPCHRVIKSTGEFNQYRWGSERKQAIIGWEASKNTLDKSNL